MQQFHVNQAYAASLDGRRIGPWVAGDTVELSEVDAEFVERDAVGTLTPVDEHGPEADPDPPAEPEQPETADAPEEEPTAEPEQPKPAADRQHRGGRRRAGA